MPLIFVTDYMDSLCKDHFLQRQYRKVDGGVLWSRNERNLDCTVTFQTHSILQRFMLHFDLLQLDCNDHLYVYDGAHATAPPKVRDVTRNYFLSTANQQMINGFRPVQLIYFSLVTKH